MKRRDWWTTESSSRHRRDRRNELDLVELLQDYDDGFPDNNPDTIENIGVFEDSDGHTLSDITPQRWLKAEKKGNDDE